MIILWLELLGKLKLCQKPDYIKYESESEVAQLCPTLCDPMDCSLQAPLSMGSSRQDLSLNIPLNTRILRGN